MAGMWKRPHLLLLPLLLLQAAAAGGGQRTHAEDGRPCSPPTGGRGRCRPLPSCPAVLRTVAAGQLGHGRCGFLAAVELVCCPEPGGPWERLGPAESSTSASRLRPVDIDDLRSDLSEPSKSTEAQRRDSREGFGGASDGEESSEGDGFSEEGREGLRTLNGDLSQTTQPLWITRSDSVNNFVTTNRNSHSDLFTTESSSKLHQDSSENSEVAPFHESFMTTKSSWGRGRLESFDSIPNLQHKLSSTQSTWKHINNYFHNTEDDRLYNNPQSPSTTSSLPPHPQPDHLEYFDTVPTRDSTLSQTTERHTLKERFWSSSESWFYKRNFSFTTPQRTFITTRSPFYLKGESSEEPGFLLSFWQRRTTIPSPSPGPDVWTPNAKPREQGVWLESDGEPAPGPWGQRTSPSVAPLPTQGELVGADDWPRSTQTTGSWFRPLLGAGSDASLGEPATTTTWNSCSEDRPGSRCLEKPRIAIVPLTVTEPTGIWKKTVGTVLPPLDSQTTEATASRSDGGFWSFWRSRSTSAPAAVPLEGNNEWSGREPTKSPKDPAVEEGAAAFPEPRATVAPDFERQPEREAGREPPERSGGSGGSPSRSQAECDKYKEQPRLTNYVIGGEQAAPGEFPHMAALGYRKRPSDQQLSWLCGGSLLSDRYVLTAAHCLATTFGDPLAVRLGFTNLSADWDTGREVAVARAVRHPLFDRRTRVADVALLLLAERLSPSQFIAPACLHALQAAPSNAQQLTVSGWGSITPDGNTPTDHLKKAEVTEVPLARCEEFYPDILQSGMMCAGSDDVVDTCKGDSGGPLQMQDLRSGVYTVVGVTSFGLNPCDGRKPGVYMRVSSYLSWIESIVWGRSAPRSGQNELSYDEIGSHWTDQHQLTIHSSAD